MRPGRKAGSRGMAPPASGRRQNPAYRAPTSPRGYPRAGFFYGSSGFSMGSRMNKAPCGCPFGRFASSTDVRRAEGGFARASLRSGNAPRAFVTVLPGVVGPSRGYPTGRLGSSRPGAHTYKKLRTRRRSSHAPAHGWARAVAGRLAREKPGLARNAPDHPPPKDAARRGVARLAAYPFETQSRGPGRERFRGRVPQTEMRTFCEEGHPATAPSRSSRHSSERALAGFLPASVPRKCEPPEGPRGARR